MSMMMRLLAHRCTPADRTTCKMRRATRLVDVTAVNCHGVAYTDDVINHVTGTGDQASTTMDVVDIVRRSLPAELNEVSRLA